MKTKAWLVTCTEFNMVICPAETSEEFGVGGGGGVCMGKLLGKDRNRIPSHKD